MPACEHTDNHDIEVEALADTFAMPLIWQVCESDKASQLSADNVSHIASCRSGCLWIF